MRCVMVMADFPVPTYLRSFDPDADNGIGEIVVTDDISDAMVFSDGGEVVECWRKPSTVRPLRHDGKPNRPLTACSIEIAPAPLAPEALKVEQKSKRAARALEPA